MQRRTFLRAAGLGGAATVAGRGVAGSAPGAANASESSSPPKGSGMKITRIRFYHYPQSPPAFNQSFNIVTVETDQGITGIGEGGSPDTVKQCAAMIIGEDPMRIEHLWQMMFRGYFYPAGREKLDGLGAIDLALWDIKGKALGVPVYELLGGLYATADPPSGHAFNSHQAVRKTFQDCTEIREGVGPDGDWALDFHTRLDFPGAVRLATLIEPLEPYFAEDLVRSENPGVYRELRAHVNVPIAVGEQFGSKWDIRWLIENQLIDFSRATLPNVGGITEYMKIAALCDTHYVGLIPHFTGPVSEAALVHCCGAFAGPVMMEMLGNGIHHYDHLPQFYDFRNGKLWPNSRPGLGVELDTKPLHLAAEITERSRPIPMFQRPDGSITNW
ncbi:MAG: mandelate racemase/muconate lactonizing enzyme family protein [Acidobacteriota bacterium]